MVRYVRTVWIYCIGFHRERERESCQSRWYKLYDSMIVPVLPYRELIQLCAFDHTGRYLAKSWYKRYCHMISFITVNDKRTNVDVSKFCHVRTIIRIVSIPIYEHPTKSMVGFLKNNAKITTVSWVRAVCAYIRTGRYIEREFI